MASKYIDTISVMQVIGCCYNNPSLLGLTDKYTIIEEKGPDHDKIFTAEVSCNNKKLAIGKGKTKKQAEMEAARKALEYMK